MSQELCVNALNGLFLFLHEEISANDAFEMCVNALNGLSSFLHRLEQHYGIEMSVSTP